MSKHFTRACMAKFSNQHIYEPFTDKNKPKLTTHRIPNTAGACHVRSETKIMTRILGVGSYLIQTEISRG
jgi:hypothetical protein